MNTSEIPKPSLEDINRSNKSLLMPLGAIIDAKMKERGLTDRKLAKEVKCSHVMIFQLRKGLVPYCGFSIVSRISLALGYSLADLLLSSPYSSAFGKEV